MSNLMKIAIPLLNEKLTLDDIQSNSGFVDAYFEDINKPALTDHIFMMYETRGEGSNTTKCFYKLLNLNNRYGMRVGYINKKPYNIYSFTTNNTIRNLRDGNIILNEKQKERVLSFWNFKDPWITNNILLGTIYDAPDLKKLPEEDYLPDMYGDEEGEVLD